MPAHPTLPARLLGAWESETHASSGPRSPFAFFAKIHVHLRAAPSYETEISMRIHTNLCLCFTILSRNLR